MLIKTAYQVPTTLYKIAQHMEFTEFKTSLNEPSGDFFYSSWKLKSQYQNTVWKDILDTLPYDIGEARIIVLKPGICYYSHADIDDRWHLNLQSNYGYLVDLKNDIMHKLVPDGYWHELNAGIMHSAVNFGNKNRVQLVVRKLLNKNNLRDPVSVKIVCSHDAVDYRYQFDQTISEWLNYANKNKLISNFTHDSAHVNFSVERRSLSELQKIAGTNFKIIEV